MAKLNAWKISAELAKRHREDLFFTEVKNGPTQFGQHRRIDALAMTKSWLNPRIVGYEIKVNRSDFIGDNKWHAYLDMCNELYFVCPKDMIDISEVPDMCGLRYVYDTLYMRTVKKAPYREIEPPVDMYLYLLMIYADSAKPPFRTDRYEQIQAYLDDKETARDLAISFKSKMLVKLAAAEREKKDREYGKEEEKEEHAEYKKMIKLLKAHVGHPFMSYPSIVLERALRDKADVLKEVLDSLEETVQKYKKQNGL